MGIEDNNQQSPPYVQKTQNYSQKQIQISQYNFQEYDQLINKEPGSNEPLLVGSYNLNEPKFPTPKYTDVWFSILFGINFVGFLVLCITSFSKFHSYSPTDGFNVQFYWFMFMYIFLILILSVVFGFCYVRVWIRLAKTHAIQLIRYSFIIVCILMVGYTIYFFVVGYIFFGILYLVISIFIVFLYFQLDHQMRPSHLSRILFVAPLLTNSVKNLDDFPSVTKAGYISILISFAWFILFGNTFVGVNLVYNGSSRILLNIYMIFTMYWVFYVIKNTLHTTISGLFANWYFLSGSDAEMPQNTLIDSTKRALTSFGSICFGSLFIPLTESLCYCSQMMMSTRNPIFKIFGYIINAFLALLRLLCPQGNFFNTYALTHTAIYGTSFCDSSRGTLKLFESRLGTTFVNDNFISWTIYIGGLCGALILSIFCSLMGILFGYVYDIFGMVLSTLTGYIIIVTALEVVCSSVVSLFTCYMLEPQILKTTYPELYHVYESEIKCVTAEASDTGY